jgi:hypothetical protein
VPKKIYDVKPPKASRKVDKEIKEFLSEDKDHVLKPTSKKHNAHHHKKHSHSIWKAVLVAIFIVVIGVAVYLFFTLPKAVITIWPKVTTLSYQQIITADKSVDSVDIGKESIPAQYFESTKTESQDFPSTGSSSDGGVASGTITIYNKYDPPMPFAFKAGTHFMSDSGKLFVALQKIVIPAAKKSGSKITPGSVQIQIQAVEAGDSYNIAPSNFSIPGLKGTAYYYGVYATSASAMAGGYSGKVKEVTDDDIQGANDVLVKKATADATTDLKSQITSDYILLDNAISPTTTSASSHVKSGTVADSFTYSVSVKVGALAFKKSDLQQFANSYIVSQLPQGETLLDNSFKMDYSSNTVDVSGGKAMINLNFSTGAYQNIDINSLSLSLMGENAEQIKETIDSSIGNQASKINVSFWPFWVTKSPNNQKAVNVVLKFQ